MTGEVFRFEEGDLTRPRKIGSGRVQTLPFGDQLHITLVTITPVRGAFPTDELLAYDLELCHSPEERDGLRLKDLGLLHGPAAITYDEVPLPSFILREQPPLSFLFGSCRKLHGEGEDALAAADEAIAATVSDPVQRPSALYLTGDQIYADDVSAALLPHLTELGNTLVGREEQIPGFDTSMPEIPVGGRAKLVREQAHFTSSHADHHLLTFGEYAAMYLLAWNRDVWPSELRADRSGVSDEEIKRLTAARDRLPAVRRALANVPTYMIFDDHEITDDWNLNDRWQSRVFSSLAGRRIIANGLAAYFVFQGWGNDPDRFDDAFLQTLQSHLTGRADADADRSAREYDKLLWTHRGWSYTAPGTPLTLVLDTRTQRGYDSEDGPCRLLSRSELQALPALCKQRGFQQGHPMIIISPTPLYGYEEAEWCLQQIGKLTGPYVPDVEAWHAHPGGRFDFLTLLAEELAPSRLLFLSGDVHYSFAVQAVYHDYRFPALPIVQLTSSAQKNSSAITDFVELSSKAGQLLRQSSRRFGWRIPPLRNIAANFPVLSTVAEKLQDYSHAVFGGAASPDGPFLVDDTELRSRGIETEPDFEERRAYVTPMRGDNNLGLVHVSEAALEIELRLLFPKKGRLRSKDALIKNAINW